MKYYESTCNEYIQASKQFDLHPELAGLPKLMPASLSRLGNMILYGPPGAGKYTQFLRLIEAYSENKLKPEKMKVQTEKQEYEYHISDVHYEIDLALLGCESKKIWNDAFFQIVDIVSAKKSKSGIILCKNFNAIHSELLDVFYSYIQHCRTLPIHIAFVLLTEHVSFIPNRILQCCKTISVKRPDAKMYDALNAHNSKYASECNKRNHSEFLRNVGLVVDPFAFKATENNLDLEPESILNLKELRSYARSSKHSKDVPKDVFNIVCDNVILEMRRREGIRLIELREHLYDILLYGLDITECLWYILSFFVESGDLTDLGETLNKMDTFLKYYNNNYRPIYHLESMFIYLITKIYKYNEP
jgi:hypothetical protein